MGGFLDVRKNVLHNHTLSLERFGEDVVFTLAVGVTPTCRVKITHSQLGSQKPRPFDGDSHQTEMEYVEVIISKDATWEFGGLAQKPPIAARMVRGVDRDPDRRPYAFTGEIRYDGDVHGAYIFARVKLVVAAKR